MDFGIYNYALADMSGQPAPFSNSTLGIEVTEPTIAAICGLGNVDPQHGLGIALQCPAAIEACLEHPLPTIGSRLLTILPDLDAIGAMAVLVVRANGLVPGAQMRARVAQIAASDRFDRDIWPGRRPLPVSIEDILADGNSEELAVLGACISDWGLSLQDRIETLANWLISGKLPLFHKTVVQENASRLLLSCKTEATRIEAGGEGSIATVISLEPGALRVGYRLAPVVVALNPAFQFGSGKVGRKYTIARWADGDADLDHVITWINKVEPGWGGQRGIKGSPQCTPSVLTLEKVVDFVMDGIPMAKRQSVNFDKICADRGS